MVGSCKVGVVIVSYNASLAIRITLAAVRQANNDVPYELVLVDNASSPPEREAIVQAFFRHARLVGGGWKFIQQDSNLGFSGGNNAGIRAFSGRDDISHICLLNGDVIVTDHWLDRLVEKNVDIVSAVTNKADADQCVPIDYDLSLDECLDHEDEKIRPGCLDRVRKFAEFRYRTWQEQLVETDVTFFCVLLSAKALRRIGLLDERFFPGGYEDNDYCLRARAAGISVHLARDVFIHHWGSASFGQLTHAYFTEHASRNLEYLESKHSFSLQRHPENPLVSYAADMLPALESDQDTVTLHKYHRRYRALLDPLVDLFSSEFERISQSLGIAGHDIPHALSEHIASAQSRQNILRHWQSIACRTESLLVSRHRSMTEVNELSTDLDALIDAVRDVATCNLAMHEFLERANSSKAPEKCVIADESAPASGIQKVLWLLSRGAPLLWSLRGVVFFGGYPYPERLSDGYFQRIRMVDTLFRDRWRIYVESTELAGRDRWFDRPEDKVLVLRVMGGVKRRLMVRALAVLAALRCRRVYFHSVLRMRDNRFGWLIRLPWMLRVTDIHGVVPEEFRLHNDFFSAVLYEQEERVAVRKSDLVIVVTTAMHRYLQQKYRDDLRARVAVFPMLPRMTTYVAPRPYNGECPVVVYAGGTHKWQQIPKMIDAIIRTRDICRHRVYCPEPEVVRRMLPENLRAEVVVDSKAHHELMGIYERCHFGFLLREDVVVNHVACPTKAVEYLAKGIVPIVDSEKIGDFVELGMRFVRLADFVAGRIPSEVERDEMARENLDTFRTLQQSHDAGAQAIAEMLGMGSWAKFARRLRRFAAVAMPQETVRGQLARRGWARIRHLRNDNGVTPRVVADSRKQLSSLHSFPQCDVLMQVDNFEAGGLENVVLHLCQTLAQAGKRVVLLILGNVGPAAEQARASNIPIIILEKNKVDYESLLDRLQPGVALTHYSTFGAAACAARSVPFVQVIHNAYVWLSDRQLLDLLESARYTAIFVAVSEYVKRYCVERLGLPESRFVVVPNGSDVRSTLVGDTKVIAREDMRRQLGIGPGDFVFVSVGSINHQKNHIAIVRSFAAAIEQLPDARLLILGPVYEPLLLEEIRTLIDERALSSRVIYAGAAPSPYPYLAMADAYVSAAYFEGGPLTLIEAACANLPIITTNVGCACHFEGLPGLEVIAPAIDILNYGRELREMECPGDFIDRLAEAMKRVYQTPRRPELPQEICEAMDSASTYASYDHLVSSLLQGQPWNGGAGGWTTMVEGLPRSGEGRSGKGGASRLCMGDGRREWPQGETTAAGIAVMTCSGGL